MIFNRLNFLFYEKHWTFSLLSWKTPYFLQFCTLFKIETFESYNTKTQYMYFNMRVYSNRSGIKIYFQETSILSCFWNIIAKRNIIFWKPYKSQLVAKISPQKFNAKSKSKYILIEKRNFYSNKFWFIKIDYQISWKSRNLPFSIRKSLKIERKN